MKLLLDYLLHLLPSNVFQFLHCSGVVNDDSTEDACHHRSGSATAVLSYQSSAGADA